MMGSTGRSPVSVVVVVVVVGCGAASQRLLRAAHSLSLLKARSLHVTQIKQILRLKFDWLNSLLQITGSSV
jgi:hypothetical protein